MRRAAPTALASLLLVLLLVGCPHRSPVWSPDGERIAVLAGKGGEEVDKAASQLWLADLASGKARALTCPDRGVRYLAAAWLDAGSLAVLTGKWESGFIAEGTEKVWRVGANGGDWKDLKLPPPNEARATRRPPVVIGSEKSRALVYPSGNEAILAVEIESGKEVAKLEPAELVGPGPGGGFLAYRPQPEETGTIEIAAFGADLKVLWRRKLSEIREGIAKKLGKAPVDVVFNETATSHLPAKGEKGGEEGWVGVTVIFSDVGWKDGIPGYYLRLASKTGEVLSAVRGVGLSGRPSSSSGTLWAVLAPDPKAKTPVRLETIRVEDSKTSASLPLAGIEKEAVHGYAFDPAGKRFAVSLNGRVPELRIFTGDALEKPRVIELEGAHE